MRVLVCTVALSIATLGWNASFAAEAGFSPSQWSPKEREHYIHLQVEMPPRRGEALRESNWSAGPKGIVGGTTDPFAVHAGLKVLQHGGSAADAAIATALAQIALSAGSAVSYAGLLNALYYDAASGKVYSLNAGFNSVKGETDAGSIPTKEPSGRTALVPGFMAGVETLHRRFGRLPFGELFAPAIWVASEGVPLSPILSDQMRSYARVLSRRPETRRIFTKDGAQPYRIGDTFPQPALAKTLQSVAQQGAKYMYEGEWAQHFVEAVQSEGGKMTLADLAAYRPIWSDPQRISYGGYEVLSLGDGHEGARHLLGTLKAASMAGLKRAGHYTSSPESLFKLIQIERIYMESVRVSATQQLRATVPGVSSSPEAAISQQTGERVLAYLKTHRAPEPKQRSPEGTHSAVVVAADSSGNVISLIHSINTSSWGLTGIFVDGVSIPDAGLVNRQALAQGAPGTRVPDPTNPVLALKDGKPFLAAGTIGMSPLRQLMLQNLVSILEFGMDPKTAVTQPYTLGRYENNGATPAQREQEVVLADTFSEAVIDGVRKLGQPILVTPRWQREAFWIGVQSLPGEGEFRGAASPRLPALVEAY